jgi:arylsulfatase A-like enzyme
VKPGTTSDALVGCTDVYPTVLELVGVARNPAQVMDGVSAAAVLRGTAAAARDSYVIWFPGRPHGATAYAGDWKLIRREEPSPREEVTRELFNLRDDIGETKNLAGQMPEKVKELEAIIERMLVETHAIVPKPNPAYRGKPRKAAAAAAAK